MFSIIILDCIDEFLLRSGVKLRRNQNISVEKKKLTRQSENRN